jgi:uncharacterized protein YrrD
MVSAVLLKGASLMTTFPVNAQVECVDGHGGRSTHLIVNPVTRLITHIVVEIGLLKKADHLVEIAHVASATHDTIRLNCTRGELAAMPLFTDTQYVRTEVPHPDAVAYHPFVTFSSANAPEIDQHIPRGELAVSRGTQVEALDGHVGTISEFVLDAETDCITHIVVRMGSWFNRHELTVPVSVIDRIVGDTLRLKPTRAELQHLPDLEVERKYEWTNRE